MFSEVVQSVMMFTGIINQTMNKKDKIEREKENDIRRSKMSEYDRHMEDVRISNKYLSRL